VEGIVKVWKLVWEVKGLRYNVELLSTELILHFNDVGAESIFTRHLKGVGEMVHLLVFVKVFVQMRLY